MTPGACSHKILLSSDLGIIRTRVWMDVDAGKLYEVRAKNSSRAIRILLSLTFVLRIRRWNIWREGIKERSVGGI